MRKVLTLLLALLYGVALAGQGQGPGPGLGSFGGGGGGSVVFDAQTAAVVSVNGATTMTASMTVGSGSNRALAAVLWFSLSTTPTGLACHWDPAGTNQAMTELTGANTGTNGGLSGASTIFALIAPTSGTKNLTCTWTGSWEAHISAISFTGVNQGSIGAAFPNAGFTSILTATASPISIGPITSGTGHQVFTGFAQSCSAWGAVSGTTVNSDASTGPNLAVVSSYTTGAATVTATAAFTGSCDQIASGADVSP